MAADTGALGILDASMPAPSTDSAVVDTPTIDTSTPTETSTDVSTPAETPAVEGEKSPADASVKPTEDTKSSIGNPSMKDVHTALQAWKDADPEKNGAMAKQLNGTLQRHAAMLREFPNVEAARDASVALKELAGNEGGTWKQGLESLRSIKEAAVSSDTMLYNGDATLISNIVAELTDNGKLDALGKLLGPMTEACRTHDPAGYVETQRSTFLATSEETGLTSSLNDIHSALLQGDTKLALARLKSIGGFYNDLQSQESEKAKVTQERTTLDGERTKQDSAAKATFNAEVGKEARSSDSKSLGAHLAPILRLPYFKGYSRENLQGLGAAIQQKMWEVCKSDKFYQSKMAGLWKAGDRKAILAYHKSFVDSKAKEAVGSTVKTMYPAYAKATAAKAPVAPVKDSASFVKAGTYDSSKVTQVPSKPAWNSVDWDKDPHQTLWIAGKAYLKTGALVSWRKN